MNDFRENQLVQRNDGALSSALRGVPLETPKYWHRMYEMPKPRSHKEWVKHVNRRARKEKAKMLQRAKTVLATAVQRTELSVDAYDAWIKKKERLQAEKRRSEKENRMKHVLRARILTALSDRESRHNEWHKRKAAEDRMRKKEVKLASERLKKQIADQEELNQRARDENFKKWLSDAQRRERAKLKKQQEQRAAAKEAIKQIQKEKIKHAKISKREEEKIYRRFRQFQKEGWVLTADSKTGRYCYRKPEEDEITKIKIKVEQEEANRKIQLKKQEEAKKAYKRWKREKEAQLRKDEERQKEEEKEEMAKKDQARRATWWKRKSVMSYTSAAEEPGLFEKTPPEEEKKEMIKKVHARRTKWWMRKCGMCYRLKPKKPGEQMNPPQEQGTDDPVKRIADVLKRAEKQFHQIDRNSDGYVTMAELIRQVRAGDREVAEFLGVEEDEVEVKEASRGKHSLVRMFTSADLDSDKKVSLSEYLTAVRKVAREKLRAGNGKDAGNKSLAFEEDAKNTHTISIKWGNNV